MRATDDNRETSRAHGALLRERLRQALAHAPASPLAVAFSGGPDSTALLHALAALPEARTRGLRALHVDHGLHPRSQAWAEHCQAQCAQWNVPCEVRVVSVPRDSGHGPEAAARHARYAALAAALAPGEWLLTAHHREDQAETFLLRALRAAGPDGLGAMRALRPLGRGWLWRPLLAVPRQTLRDYLHEHGLSAVEDPANLDPRHDRSWLRQHVLPLLRQRWPQADAALARSAELCAEAAQALAQEDVQALAAARSEHPQALSAAALSALPRTARARVLRAWIAGLGLPPLPARALACIEAQLLTARPDARAQARWPGAVVRRWRDLLHAEHPRDRLPHDWHARWDGRAPLTLPGGGSLRLAPLIKDSVRDGLESSPSREGLGGDGLKPSPSRGGLGGDDFKPSPSRGGLGGDGVPIFTPPLTVRPRHGGERIRLPGREHTHTLKHALQALAVPPWERERLPLLIAADGELLAAGDRVLSARMDAWLRERAARLVWCR